VPTPSSVPELAPASQTFREPRPRQLYGETVDRRARVAQRLSEGHLRLVREPGEMPAIKASGVPGALPAVEGAPL
jgi:hypothetical protein